MIGLSLHVHDELRDEQRVSSVLLFTARDEDHPVSLVSAIGEMAAEVVGTAQDLGDVLRAALEVALESLGL